MAQNINVTENEIAFAVLQIAATQPNGIATFPRMKREIPDYVNLSNADRRQSISRRREEVWEQRIRNIKSHYETPGNYICEGYLEHVPRSGYRITERGKQHLRART